MTAARVSPRKLEDQAMPATVPLGRLRFDPHSLVLYDRSEVVPLAPLPAQLLAELISAGGSVVSGGAIRKALWADAPIEDRNLNQQLYVLRRVLRRDPSVAIENVPRRGYRLVVAPRAAPAVVAAPRRLSRFAWACVAVAAIALMWRGQQTGSAAAAFNRDLALANYLATSEGPDHLDRAAAYYRDLISRAPNSGAGYGGLAVIDAKRALELSGDPRWHAFEAAQREAAAASQRNANDGNALTALGIIASLRDHRQDIASRMFDAAVAAEPAAESPRSWRASFRSSIGDFEGAGDDLRTNVQNSPTSGGTTGLLGTWLVLNRDYVQASTVLAQAVVLGKHPAYTRQWLARAYYLRGLDAEAVRLLNEVNEMYPNEGSTLALRALIEVRRGRTQAATAAVRRIERMPARDIEPITLAAAEDAIGKRASALRTLRRAASSETLGFNDIARLLRDPYLDALRKDPRFAAAVSLRSRVDQHV